MDQRYIDERLANDHRLLRQYERAVNHSRQKLVVTPVGSAPHREYVLTFNCVGYIDERGTERTSHEVRLMLPDRYPMAGHAPRFFFTQPILHPNIYPTGFVCLGFETHPWRENLLLSQQVERVSRIIRFDRDSMNLSSLANQTRDFWTHFLARVRVPADNDPFVALEPRPRDAAPARRAHPVPVPAPAPPPPARTGLVLRPRRPEASPTPASPAAGTDGRPVTRIRLQRRES